MDREEDDGNNAGIGVDAEGNDWREEGEARVEDEGEYDDGEKDGSENNDDDDNDDDHCPSSPHHRQRGQRHRPGSSRPRPFLVNANTLELNVPFCLAFFCGLSARESHLVPAKTMGTWRRGSMTPLSGLNNLVDGGVTTQPS